MATLNWAFDGLLGLGLLWLAWRTLTARERLPGILLFIVFGLLMALCWARLAAPDVALAEAAIGAGLTGALLLDAQRALAAAPVAADSGSRWLALVVALLAGGLLVLLALALLSLPPVPGLADAVMARIDESGVSNPVTAVLLNFRAYDTLLEVAVLLLALLGVWQVRPLAAVPDAAARRNPIVDTLLRLLAPVALLTAAYLLWAGAFMPGGAFQAGAVLAGLGVLLRLTHVLQPVAAAGFMQRLLLGLGLLVFTAVGMALLLRSALLAYPPAWAGTLILLIESALTVSIGLILAALFVGGPLRLERRP